MDFQSLSSLKKYSDFCAVSERSISTLNCQQSGRQVSVGRQMPWSVLGAEPTEALKVVLVGQRARHDGKQEAEEPVPGLQTLMGTITHSDLFAPPFASIVLWEPL